MRSTKYMFSLAVSALAWGGAGVAEAQSPAPAEPSAPTPTAPAPDSAPAEAAETPTGELTIEQLAAEAEAAAESEIITVWAERPDKPFDRDTKLRLTGEELAARGATDLGTALAMLPDLTVREGGRGGFNVDVRGARKGSVRILLDGVSVSDPYYGTFDVSTIPITDIEQIRVSTSPSSPIDGPGGPGGVIEVHTRDAVGPQLVRARLTTDDAPSLGVAGTARVALSRRAALRISTSGTAGARDFSLPMDATIGESRRSASGAARLELRDGARRIAVDVSADDRHYLSPPSDELTSTILLIDRETALRSQVAWDDRRGALQLSGRVWVDHLRRRSRVFRDPALLDQVSTEDLRATRVGAQALATRPIGRDARWAASATVDRDAARVRTESGGADGDGTLTELAVDGQLERAGFLIDGAVGLAAPFGVGAGPWLEAKLDVRYQVRPGIELAAIAARKGRTPSLRERFDPRTGNEELDPELASHGELRLTVQRGPVKLELAPFLRRTTGTVRLDGKRGLQSNLGQLDVRGVDTSGQVALGPAEAGASYSYITATSDLVGADPLDRLPRHRFDVWARATPHAKVSALARLRYIGRRIDQTKMLGAYTTVEGTLTAELSEAYLAVARVEDLLDTRPEIRSGYHTAGRVISLLLQGTWE
ncbi:MAG: TonB-dependent receptor [Kofleriaceae bacterium]